MYSPQHNACHPRLFQWKLVPFPNPLAHRHTGTQAHRHTRITGTFRGAWCGTSTGHQPSRRCTYQDGCPRKGGPGTCDIRVPRKPNDKGQMLQCKYPGHKNFVRLTHAHTHAHTHRTRESAHTHTHTHAHTHTHIHYGALGTGHRAHTPTRGRHAPVCSGHDGFVPKGGAFPSGGP